MKTFHVSFQLARASIILVLGSVLHATAADNGNDPSRRDTTTGPVVARRVAPPLEQGRSTSARTATTKIIAEVDSVGMSARRQAPMQSATEGGGSNRVTRLAPNIIAEVGPQGATPLSLNSHTVGSVDMAESDSGSKGAKARVARHEHLDAMRSDEFGGDEGMQSTAVDVITAAARTARKEAHPVEKESAHITAEKVTDAQIASAADLQNPPIAELKNRSSLFQLWQKTSSDTFMVVGVPIVNYKHRRAATGSMARQKSLLQQSPQSQNNDDDEDVPRIWIVETSDDYCQHGMHKFCEHLHGEATCIFEGNCKHGGVRELIINATDRELHLTLADHSDIIKLVTTDTVVRGIPEVEDEADSLLETGKPKYGEWGLDRISNKKGKILDGMYNAPPDAGKGVHVYIMDTGIRTTHVEFEGRAIPTIESLGGGNPKECDPDDSECAMDRQGHGTHCAGVVMGRSTGVAKKATAHAVKVLGDDGVGDLMNLVRAMDWVLSKGERPAIVSASLGGPGAAGALGRMIEEATEKGVTVVVAAGNENDDACDYSPSSVAQAITVGSTTIDDKRSSFSNYGKCVDIFGPGSKVKSTGIDSDTYLYELSGTSIACPHVAGAVALLLWADVKPEDVQKRLQRDSTKDVVTDARNGSPNMLLHVKSAKASNNENSTYLEGWDDYKNACNSKCSWAWLAKLLLILASAYTLGQQ